MGNTAIITGGAGYVGTHLIYELIEQKVFDLIVILDIQPLKNMYHSKYTKVKFIECDLRNPVDVKKLKDAGCDSNTVIYNLAAICRIPGFPDIDYFRTNILGAENTCKLADNLGANQIIFTSSISPYGASEELKNEDSIPQPKDPYGSSKLVAEYIHKGWLAKDPDNRRLTILRPGIIFGKGEQANFTRLYESLKKGFFVYPGRNDTKKACVYVKDVAKACYHFTINTQDRTIFNMVYEEAPTIETICLSLAKNTDAKKPLLRIPAPLIMFAAYLIMIVGKVIKKEFTGIHPDRVKKVMISTNISGKRLKESDFQLNYSLDDAIRDWWADCNNSGLE